MLRCLPVSLVFDELALLKMDEVHLSCPRNKGPILSSLGPQLTSF